jgi:hypothetical protein
MPFLPRPAHLSILNLLKMFLIPGILAATLCWAQTPVVTWHYDNSRSGADTTEVLLTPSNVNANSFGKLFTQPVDGIIVGHPLYLPGVSIPAAGVHNVVYVATMNDTVYAFDANSGGQSALWTTSLLSYSPAGATPVPIDVKGCKTTVQWTETGVISTPVIDPVANIIYLMAETYESGHVVHRMHALDITTGMEETGWPVTVTATYTYNGVNYTFLDTHEMNRPGLLLSDGYVYAGFGSPGCNGDDQGWVMAFNTATAQLDAFDLEPGTGGRWGSVWQKGAGLSADSEGYIYADTGEGAFAPGVDLTISVFKVNPASSGQMSLADWFSPWNYQYLSDNDMDINNAVVILPDQTGPVPHEAITMGKEGTVYLLNRDDMGQLCSTCEGSDTQIVQELLKVAEMGYSPVVWNGSVYITGSHQIQIYSLNNGLLSLGASRVIGLMTHPVVTANGTTNGIVWLINGPKLVALNALTLAQLYTSDEASGGRDTLPALAHFASPIVADGEVFIGTQNNLAVYGLFPALTVAGGNQQSGTIQATLPVALQVQAVNLITGAVIPGVAVTFSDGKDGGAFGTPSGVTDSNGMFSTTYTLPTKTGSWNVTADATGYSSASFSETALPGTETGVSRVSGNGQTATVGTPLPNPLVVKVHDVGGNGVPGISVTFSDRGAGGAFSANPVTTNSLGEASVTYTAGNNPGTVIIDAGAGNYSQSFRETIDASSASAIQPPSRN